MSEDPIGAALRELVPEPPPELSMARLTAARSARRRRGALVAGTAAAVVLVVLAIAVPAGLSARDGTPAATRPTTTSILTNLVVTHPAEWAYQETEEYPSTASLTAGYLSTEPLPRSLCHTLPPAGGVTGSECGPPTVTLGRNGALIQFSEPGLPGTRLGKDGAGTTIGGRPARQLVTDGRGCGATPADLRVQTSIKFGAISGRDVLVTVDACLRGPDLTRSRAELAALLASIRYRG